MARITITGYTESFTSGSIDAVDYQIAKITDPNTVVNDEYFEELARKEKETGHRHLIVNIEKDPLNVEYLDTPLPKLPEDITQEEIDSNTPLFYKDLSNMAIRIRLHSLETKSNWYHITNKSQREQLVPVTQKGEYQPMSDSFKLGWTDKAFDTTHPEVLQPIIIQQEQEDPDA